MPSPSDIEAILRLKHEHDYFIILWETLPDGGKKPRNLWRQGAEPVSDRAIRAHDGFFGYRHSAEAAHIIDVDYHGGENAHLPLAITEALKFDEACHHLEETPRGWHIYTPPGAWRPKQSGAPRFGYRGLSGELRAERCCSIIYEPANFVDWLDEAVQPPSAEFYAELLDEPLPSIERATPSLAPASKMTERGGAQHGAYGNRNNHMIANTWYSIMRRANDFFFLKKCLASRLDDEEEEKYERETRYSWSECRRRALRWRASCHAVTQRPEYAELSPAFRRVLATMWSFAHQSGFCWAKVDSIQSGAKCCKRHVYRALNALKEAGLIRAVGRKQHHPNNKVAVTVVYAFASPEMSPKAFYGGRAVSVALAWLETTALGAWSRATSGLDGSSVSGMWDRAGPGERG